MDAFKVKNKSQSLHVCHKCNRNGSVLTAKFANGKIQKWDLYWKYTVDYTCLKTCLILILNFGGSIQLLLDFNNL